MTRNEEGGPYIGALVTRDGMRVSLGVSVLLTTQRSGAFAELSRPGEPFRDRDGGELVGVGGAEALD